MYNLYEDTKTRDANNFASFYDIARNVVVTQRLQGDGLVGNGQRRCINLFWILFRVYKINGINPVND